MQASDFDEGDNFNSPYISGYEILLDKIVDDMISNPRDYKPWEIAFLADVPAGCYQGYYKDVCAFIDDWCEQRTYEDCA